MNSIQVSMVGNATDTATKNADAVKIIAAIRTGKWRAPVERIRAEYHRVLTQTSGDHKAAKLSVDAMKKATPAILWSGTFASRHDVAIITHSGLLCADLDYDELGQRIGEVRAKLIADPHVWAAFVSPTGVGLKVVFAVRADAALHLRSFRAVEHYVFTTTGVAIDTSCKNESRACFVSYDPEAYLNTDAIELPPLVETPQPPRPAAPPLCNGELQTRRDIAEGLLGEIDWTTETRGYAVCPGEHLHTTRTEQKHCEVYLDGDDGHVPSMKCVHNSCDGLVKGAVHELRSRIGKAEFHAEGHVESKDDEEEEDPQFDVAPWPEPLAPAAFHGLAGDAVRAIDPHTEADPAGVLIMFLSSFGNMAGAGAHFMAEARRHPLRIWPLLTGETAKGRKGSAWSSLRHILEHVDEQWLRNCTASGLSSGEGLVWAVRDPIVRQKKGKDGTTESFVEDEGIQDKRLLTIEEEFSAVLKAAAREGNTVSDLLRRAWEHGDLRTMTKNSPAKATGAHVSVIGHITKPDLSRLLKESDALNGFGNRFLWLAVRRSKLLPEGGDLAGVNLSPLILRLRQALDFARTTTLLKRTEAARELWRTVYPVLTADRHGLVGAILNRAEAQVMRLACAYAVLDRQSQVDVAHLEAALAVWDYCDRSARFIFGEALGDRLADRILDELRAVGRLGLTRSQLHELLARNVSVTKLNEALGFLSRLRLVTWKKEKPHGGERRTTVWRADPLRKERNYADPDPLNSLNSLAPHGENSSPAPPGEADQPAVPAPEPVVTTYYL
jgi:hypothetical protein